MKAYTVIALLAIAGLGLWLRYEFGDPTAVWLVGAVR